MEKIDVHVHCAPRRTARRGHNPRDPLDNYTADPSELETHLRKQGIGHAILMSSGEHGASLDAGCSNAECQKIAGSRPDFFSWMCNFDPVSAQTVYDRMARCKEQGAVGVGELTVNAWMDSPFLTAVFSAAEKLELPVTIHMSPEPGFSYGVCDRPGLPLLEQTLQRFPGLKVIGHSQVFWLEISADCPRAGNQARSGFGSGRVVPEGRVVQLMRRYDNLYCDLSAYSGSCAILRDEAYGLAFLEAFPGRIFYATDTVNSRQVFPLGSFLDRCLEENRLSEETWRNICCQNAQRVFRLCSQN